MIQCYNRGVPVLLPTLLLLVVLNQVHIVDCTIGFRGSNTTTTTGRILQTNTNVLGKEPTWPYYGVSSESVLGGLNKIASIGNPLKGHVSNHVIGDPFKNKIPFSMEAFYYPFDRVVIGSRQYNWTDFDETLDFVANRNAHSIPRFFIHYPGHTTLSLPQHLIGRVKTVLFHDKGMTMASPIYNDTLLMDTIREFIYEFGRRYDGDKRIAVIQAGIVGYWGEWHCSGNDFLSQSVLDNIMRWYSQAFSKTDVQLRYEQDMVANDDTLRTKFGYHDDSFTHSTLDGKYNGNIVRNRYFWPMLVNAGLSDVWKWRMIGGEVRPENTAIVHNPSLYRSNKEYFQDYNSCVQITHTTYMKNSFLFRATLSSTVRANAIRASAEMGYNFRIRQVSAQDSIYSSINAKNKGQFIDVYVTIEQIGIAPFYYDLGIQLVCNDSISIGNIFRRQTYGVQQLSEQYMTGIYIIPTIPATIECLKSIQLTLVSSYANSNGNNKTGSVNRLIVFAQGYDGIVTVPIPLPPGSTGQRYTENGILAPIPLPMDDTDLGTILNPPPTTSVSVPVPIPTPKQLSIPAPTAISTIKSTTVGKRRYIDTFSIYNTEQGRTMIQKIFYNHKIKLSDVGSTITMFCTITNNNKNSNPNRFDIMNSTIVDKVTFTFVGDRNIDIKFTVHQFGVVTYAMSSRVISSITGVPLVPTVYNPSSYLLSTGKKNITASAYNRKGDLLESRFTYFELI